MSSQTTAIDLGALCHAAFLEKIGAAHSMPPGNPTQLTGMCFYDHIRPDTAYINVSVAHLSLDKFLATVQPLLLAAKQEKRPQPLEWCGRRYKVACPKLYRRGAHFGELSQVDLIDEEQGTEYHFSKRTQGSTGDPNMFVVLKASAFARRPTLSECWEHVLEVLSTMSIQVLDHALNRLDIAIDLFEVPIADFAAMYADDTLVTRAKKSVEYDELASVQRTGKRVTCISIGGKHLMCRVYDKIRELRQKSNPDNRVANFCSARFHGITPEHVTRVEFQMQSRWFRERDIIHVDDWTAKSKGLLAAMTDDWMRWYPVGTDTKHSRRHAVHPHWQRVQNIVLGRGPANASSHRPLPRCMAVGPQQTPQQKIAHLMRTLVGTARKVAAAEMVDVSRDEVRKFWLGKLALRMDEAMRGPSPARSKPRRRPVAPQADDSEDRGPAGAGAAKPRGRDRSGGSPRRSSGRGKARRGLTTHDWEPYLLYGNTPRRLTLPDSHHVPLAAAGETPCQRKRVQKQSQ